MSDELKLLIEPFNLGLLKPLGEIKEDILDVKKGKYYYFPHFQDTRIYWQGYNEDGNYSFNLFTEDFDTINILLQTLKSKNDNEDAINIVEKLESYMEYLKKFAEEMKRKEASKIRKLQSQIRSRKIIDRNKKKL